MKNIFLFALCMLLLTACKDNPAMKKINEAREGVSGVKNLIKESDKMQEDILKLTETTPLTNEELKSWLPEVLDGMKRSSYKTGAMGAINIASMEATYDLEDKSKSFKIEIMDGAGEIGAMSMAGIRMMFTQDFEEESEFKMRRSTVKNGNKAIEEVDKKRNDAVVQYLQDGRFYVKASGTNMDLEELWKLVEKMNVKGLV